MVVRVGYNDNQLSFTPLIIFSSYNRLVQFLYVNENIPTDPMVKVIVISTLQCYILFRL